MPLELNREYVDNLHKLIEQFDEKSVSTLLQPLHAADIAEIFSVLSMEEAKFLYKLLDGEKRADVIIELEDDRRERFLRALSGEEIARHFIEEMDSDDAADVIGDLSEELQEEILQNIKDIEQASDIVDLLSYDEETAGGLMAKELIQVVESWDIPTCLREMRKQAEDVDEVYFIYVVDEDNILKGTLSLKKLLLSSRNEKVSNLYKSDIISVKTDTNHEEVANIMRKYDLVALPVIDSIGRLLGRITIDDVVDVMQEEAEKDFQLASGITEDVEPSDNVFLLTRARLPWLFIGLLGGILAALILGGYEADLRLYPEMAFFIPLIAAMGGNVGVQSSAIIVQGLAGKSLISESTGKKLMKELLVAAMNGVVLSGLALVYNLAQKESLALTLSVSSALFSVIIFASVFGTFIPLVLERFKIDPALATGPFITTMNDIISLFIYLIIGRMLYGII